MRLALINSDITNLGLNLDRMGQIPYVQAGILVSIFPLLLLAGLRLCKKMTDK